MAQKVIDTLTQTDGLETFPLVSAASTNATAIKKGPCKLYGWYIGNTSAAFSYVCFHDTASLPTAGANVKAKLAIPTTGAANVLGSGGIQFNDGLAITTVTGSAIGNTTAVAVGDLVINLFFK